MINSICSTNLGWPLPIFVGCNEIPSGFSLHARVTTKAHARDKLEKICRYIARPAVSEERLSTDDAGTEKEKPELGKATGKGLQHWCGNLFKV